MKTLKSIAVAAILMIALSSCVKQDITSAPVVSSPTQNGGPEIDTIRRNGIVRHVIKIVINNTSNDTFIFNSVADLIKYKGTNVEPYDLFDTVMTQSCQVTKYYIFQTGDIFDWNEYIKGNGSTLRVYDNNILYRDYTYTN